LTAPALEAPGRGIDYPNVETGAEIHSDQVVKADVVVVGSGAGGATAAAALAEAGLEVVIVEEGGLHRTESFTTDPIHGIQRLYRDAGTSVIFGKPSILFAEGRCVGGSTVINGGMCWRTPDRVLDDWTGGHGLPDVSPRAMEPHFARAEEILHAESQQPDTLGRHSHLFLQGAQKLGWTLEPNRRNMRRCMGLNNCSLGCPTGAKQSMLVTEVPRALRAGARLFTNARVRRVLFKGRRAIGVRGEFMSVRNRLTHGFEIHAPLVVLAAGARHTPGILLRSRVRARALGRYLQVHPNAKVVGVFEERIDPWVGAHQTHQLHQFLDEGILIAYATVPPGLLASGLPGLGATHAARMRQYNHMLTAATLVEDTGEGRVRLGPDRQPYMTFRLSPRDIETIHRGVALTAQILFAAGAREVLLPFAHLPQLGSADEIQKIHAVPRRPGAIELMTVHIMGSARMACDPRDGVVDPWGFVHGIEGLAVADASLFPSSVGVNPQESIVALVLRNVERMADAARRPGRSRL
jgi:choline dehydrogenase-like flavoprotein